MRKKKNKNYLVIGLGRFGARVALTLAEMGFEVLAIDINEESVQSVSKAIPHCVIADATKKNVLQEFIGKNGVDVAVVAIGNNLQASILSIVNLKNLGIKKIAVRADVTDHKELFEMVGATDVIIPEESSAISLANQITSDTIVDYYNVSGEYGMYKIEVGAKFKAKSLIDLNLRNAFDINIVGIIKDNGEFFIPRGSDLLTPGDTVVVVGVSDKINKFSNFVKG